MINERNPRSFERRPALPPPRGRAFSRLLLPLLLHPLIAGCSSTEIPAQCLHSYVQGYADEITSAAKKEGVPVDAAYAIVWVEGFKGSRGRDGEESAMQVMEETGQDMCEQLDIDPCNLDDPNTNIRVGMRYFKNMIDFYDGNVVRAARGYNGGTGGAYDKATDKYEERFIAYRAQVNACAQAATSASQSTAPESVQESPSTLIAGPTHTIHSGETLSHIARRYGVTVEALMQANGIANANHIKAGVTINIPVGAVSVPESNINEINYKTYTIQKDDRLADIANRYGVSLKNLAKKNNIGDVELIYAGQTLFIPAR